MMRIFKPRKLDCDVIWKETEEKLIEYFSKEKGYSDTYIRENLAVCIDLFERLLKEGVKENEKI